MSLWLWWRLIKIPSRFDAPLTALVRDMDPVLRDHLDSVGIHFRGQTAEVSLRFALFMRSDADLAESPWAGGERNGTGDAKRWPTRVRELSLDVPMGEQLQNLETSGLLGGLRNTRNRTGNNFAGLRPKRSWGPPAGRSWRLLTHAGTDSERSAWLEGIQRRMSSTPGKSEIESIT